MKTTNRLLMAAALGMVLPVAASAQGTPAPAPAPATPPAAATSTTGSNKMDIGKWAGTITPSQAGGQTLDVEVNVAADGDSVKATFDIPAAGMSAQVSTIKVEATKISFVFTIQDSNVKCALDKQDDGRFSGQCVDQNGDGGPMTIAPPKKGLMF